GRPGRDLPVDPFLQFDDERAYDRQYDQARKYFFRFHHLAGLNQQESHAALAGTADHLGGDNQDHRHAHAEVQPGKNAGNGGWNDDFHLNLPAIGAKVLRRLDQALVGLADAGIGADHDRKERGDRADDDFIDFAGAEPDHQKGDQRNLRQRIERRNPRVGDACDDA